MERGLFAAAMYLRLSREDGGMGHLAGERAYSNSIRSQRDFIKEYLSRQEDIKLYDIYTDDGFSGSNFDRPEFQRMLKDIQLGRVNCVIVKDLSRFGRDYVESGRYIQKIFPTLQVRFIAITDHYDSLYADIGESQILLPIKNFINDAYCRDISVKVKSQLEVKRKNGECVAPFVPYGYQKATDNKNQLVIDAYAADIVKRIFTWKIEGMSIFAIAEKLNALGILSPKEYKKFMGSSYRGGFFWDEASMWSNAAIKRILTNRIYLGNLVQGKTEKISYKLKKSMVKPQADWIEVENTHQAIISKNLFEIVQNLLKTDGRISPSTGKNHLFVGMLFCGDCKEQMIRRSNHSKQGTTISYICSSKNRGEGCTRHSIKEDTLTQLLQISMQSYLSCFIKKSCLLGKDIPFDANETASASYEKDLIRLKQEADKYRFLCSKVSEDFKRDFINEEEFERLSIKFKEKVFACEEALKQQALLKMETMKKRENSFRRLKAMQESFEIGELDRFVLCSMIKKIFVYEHQRIEIEFFYADPYSVFCTII